MREQFDQQRALGIARDDMRAGNAAAHRFDGVRKIKARVGREIVGFQ